MAAKTASYTIDTTPKLIADASNVHVSTKAQVIVQHVDGDTVFIGGPDVTPATGIGVPLMLPITDIGPGDSLYAVTETSADIRVLTLGL